MIFKNVINQGLYVKAIDKTTGAGKTGDAANITATWSKDGAASAATTDVNPTEIGGGIYHFDITQAESNCDRFALTPSSTTSDVLVSPVFGYTQAGAIPTAAPGANGGLPTVDANNRIAGMQGTVNNLNNLDAAVSSRSSHAAPDLSNLDVAVSTRSSHAAPDLSNLDVAVSTRSSHTANAVRDAILNRVLALNHDTAGTVGKLLQFLDAAITGIPTAAQNRSEMDANSTQLAAILADTGTDIPATLSAIVGYIDTEIAAIKAVTDLLPDGGALTALSGEATTAVQQLTHASHGLASLRVFLNRVDALIEDSAGDRFTAKALEQAPSGGGGGDTKEAIAAEVDTVLSAAHGGGSWAAGGSGSGAYSITVTVKEGANLLEAATVRVTEGANTYTAATNASGQASFSLDAATYAVAITKAGYSFTPTTRTVTGAQAGTLINDLLMTATTIPSAPADASLCRVYGYLETLDNQAAANVVIRLELDTPAGAKSNRMIAERIIYLKTDSNGDIVPKDLQRNDQLTPSGTTYKVTCAELGWDEVSLTLAAATKDLADLIT